MIPETTANRAHDLGFLAEYKPRTRHSGWPTTSTRPYHLWHDGVCRSYTSLDALNAALDRFEGERDACYNWPPEVGDMLTFKVPTRFHCRVATRPVTKVLANGDVAVSKYNGWSDFLVHEYEAISIKRKEA